MLVDSHCHLEFPDFAAEPQAVIDRARAAGVGHFLTISTRVHRFDEIARIAEAHADISCSLGTHPHSAEEEGDITTARLVEMGAHPRPGLIIITTTARAHCSRRRSGAISAPRLSWTCR
jgi:TatD DNase family protein